EVARSTVPINPWQQIQLVEQRITTRENLVRLARELNVYGDRTAELTEEEMAQDIRNRTVFRQLDMGALGGNQGTTVFSVSFDARGHGLAAGLVNADLARTVDRSARLRTDRASEATRFFARDGAHLTVALSGTDADILACKAAHQDALPENLEFPRT